MWFLHVFVVTAVLQWSVVTGEGQTDQFTLSLCRVWEECLETAKGSDLEHAELGTPEAICGDFLDMLKKHRVDCGTLTTCTKHSPEGTCTAGVKQVKSPVEPESGDEEQLHASQPKPGNEEEAQKIELGNKQHLPPRKPANADNQETYLDDCSGIYTAEAMYDEISSGVFTNSIKPHHANDPISVYCDQITDGGGWTVIQRRFDGSLEFFRNMGAYQNGFGDSTDEYWLGLDNIHHITDQNTYELYIELEDWSGNVKHARYSSFSVGPWSDYTLSVGGYSGTAGDGFSLSDSLYTNNGMKFSTRLNDRDTNPGVSMAEFFGGGWWYGSGSYSNLNGPYFRDTDGFNGYNGNGVKWNPFSSIDHYYSLKKTKMMIRPTDFSTRVANMRLGKK